MIQFGKGWNARALGNQDGVALHVFGVQPGQCPPGTFRWVLPTSKQIFFVGTRDATTLHDHFAFLDRTGRLMRSRACAAELMFYCGTVQHPVIKTDGTHEIALSILPFAWR